MATMIVELEWDEEELGKDWMNKYNLALLLYGVKHTNKNLLTAQEIYVMPQHIIRPVTHSGGSS